MYSRWELQHWIWGLLLLFTILTVSADCDNKLKWAPFEFFAPSPLLRVGSWLHRFKSHCEQQAMRDEGVIYVAGHPLLNRRCTRLPGCIRLRNDLYCVEWGVKLYSLTVIVTLPSSANLLLLCWHVVTSKRKKICVKLISVIIICYVCSVRLLRLVTTLYVYVFCVLVCTF